MLWLIARSAEHRSTYHTPNSLTCQQVLTDRYLEMTSNLHGFVRLLEILGLLIRKLASWQEILVNALERVEANDGAADIALGPCERHLKDIGFTMPKARVIRDTHLGHRPAPLLRDLLDALDDLGRTCTDVLAHPAATARQNMNKNKS